MILAWDGVQPSARTFQRSTWIRSVVLVPASPRQAYHLNVGFNLSFSVKELVEAIATLDSDAVDIKAPPDGMIAGVSGIGNKISQMYHSDSFEIRLYGFRILEHQGP